MEPKIELTFEELISTCVEYQRRYTEEPDRFHSEAAKLFKEDSESRGASGAIYFLKILSDKREE